MVGGEAIGTFKVRVDRCVAYNFFYFRLILRYFVCILIKKKKGCNCGALTFHIINIRTSTTDRCAARPLCTLICILL